MTHAPWLDRRQFFRTAASLSMGSVAANRGLRAMNRQAEQLALPPTSISMVQASRMIRARQLTSVELVRAMLQRIDVYNPKLNAYITVARESALAEAERLDKEAAAGRFHGPLHGIPIAVKDNIDTAHIRTTAASVLFDDRVPAEDAFVVGQLRNAGAVIIGKTNMHEFAMGGSSATTYFGPVRNPWALDRIPAGSSGGSAVAVIAGLTCGAIGTDTGGSIRMPAAYCSVVGLMPTYGLVSLRGILPLIYSLDHCGPMTQTVEDAALLLNAMAGYDKLDVASVEHPREDYVARMREPVSSLRLGIPREPFFDHLDPEIAAVSEEAIKVLSGLMRSTRNVQLPSVGQLPWTAVRSGEVEAVHEALYRRHPDGYSLQTRRVVEDTKRELNDPTQACSSKVVDYVNANWDLIRLRKTIDDAFTDFDLVALPTMRIAPRTINDELDREEAPRPREPEITSNSIAFDLYGIPAMSLPCGFFRDGLPIGLTIAGPRFSEGKILALGRAYEQATQWHSRRPNLTPDMAVPPISRKS